MNAIEYTMCVVELWPTVAISSGIAFCVGVIVGFVLHNTLKK